MIRRRGLLTTVFAAMSLLAAPAAHAIPALQLWSPDAQYDASLETWVLTEGTFELWVIGDVGSKGTIYDVDLAASFYGTSGSITLTALSGPNPVIDPTPEDAGGYDNIIHHAEYAGADGHEFWSIGDLTSTADLIQDYQPGGDPGTSTGHIYKLMVSISGYDAVHFDAFDHYFTGGTGGTSAGYKSHYVFAPFSHDATGGGGGGGGGEAAEPGSLWMLGAGFAGLLATARRTRARK